jgi:hypothetical protein
MNPKFTEKIKKILGYSKEEAIDWETDILAPSIFFLEY